jgi:hypothetical protein
MLFEHGGVDAEGLSRRSNGSNEVVVCVSVCFVVHSSSSSSLSMFLLKFEISFDDLKFKLFANTCSIFRRTCQYTNISGTFLHECSCRNREYLDEIDRSENRTTATKLKSAMMIMTTICLVSENRNRTLQPTRYNQKTLLILLRITATRYIV